MKYLFDTDSVSIFYDAERNPEHIYLQQHVSRLHDNDVLQISALKLYEFEYSYFNADTKRKEQIRRTIQCIEETFAIIPLKREFARLYGEIKTLLKQTRGSKSKEMKRHNIDLMLASSAVGESSVLIGSDRIYKELSSLYLQFQTENWFISP